MTGGDELPGAVDAFLTLEASGWKGREGSALLAHPVALPGLRLEAALVHTASHMPQIDGIRAPFRERRDPLATYGVFGTNVFSAGSTCLKASASPPTMRQ